MKNRPIKYWIIVASKDHVQMGVAGGFAQACHGKAQPFPHATLRYSRPLPKPTELAFGSSVCWVGEEALTVCCTLELAREAAPQAHILLAF